MHQGSTIIQERKPPPPLPTAPAVATLAQRSLPWDRSPAFYGLSPHALKVYRESPLKFFFRYCGPWHLRWPGMSQIPAMAVGQGVDSLAKDELIRLGWYRDRRRSFRNKKLNGRSFSIFGEVDQSQRRMAVSKKVHDTWSGLRQTAIWDKFRSMTTVDLECSLKDPTWVHGVPLNGKLDFLFLDVDNQRVVADMKINGSFSNSSTSPTPGYCTRYDLDVATGALTEGSPHPRAGEPMEALHSDFASQLATYCIMEDAKDQETNTPDIGQDSRVMLIQATYGVPTAQPKVRKDGTSRITYTLIDTHVTGAYKRSVLSDYRALWDSVENRTLVPDELAVFGETFLYMLQGRPWPLGG